MNIDATQRRFQGEHGRDEFQREPIAANVIKLLISETTVSPMVIDGDWGTGKTEFCHKLINKFRAEHDNYRLVYVDAFKADHADNSLLSILAEILKLLPEGKQRESLIQKALPVIRYGLKTVLKAGIGHVLKKDADRIPDELEEALKEATDKAIDASIEVLLQEHEQAEASLKALQTLLVEIAAEYPIVLFIDELDRCRPDFAVQMLEVIKHTFEVPGVQFVLVTNTTQLKAAVNHCYGAAIDAQRYLNKFLKFSFILPETLPEMRYRKSLVSVEHFYSLSKNSSILQNILLSNHQDDIFKFTVSLIEINFLSLRETEGFVRHLEIYQTLSNILSTTNKGYQALSIFGVFVFCLSPDVSRSIIRESADALHITKLLGVLSMPLADQISKRNLQYHEEIALMLAHDCKHHSEKFLLPEEVKNDWQEITRYFFNYSFSEKGGKLKIVADAIKTLSLNNPA